jgi:effector-binding domain-containing protein
MVTMPIDRIPIGRFSLITRLSQKALRLYDENGLLVPGVRDQFTGYRGYSYDQLSRGMLLSSLVRLGFPLGEVKDILDARERGDRERIAALFAKRSAGVRHEIMRLQEIGALLASENAPWEIVTMNRNPVIVKQIEPLRVIAKREKGIYPVTIPRQIGELCGCVFSPENQRAGVTMAGPVMTLYHDGDYKEQDADIECMIPVAGRIAVSDPAMEIKTVPGGKFLTILHKGPYPQEHESWMQLYAYAEEKGIPVGTPGREMYLNSPQDVPEEELLTELQLPCGDKGESG